MTIRIAFAGGGTGGHIYPALGIDDGLRVAFAERRYDRRFFGNRNGLEAKLVRSMPLIFVPSAPLQRTFTLRVIATLGRNIAGIGVALRELRAYRPMLLVATGGYVCFPVVVAARLLRAFGLLDCRIALLEINARPGLTNRLLAPLVDDIWITYALTQRFLGARAVLTGTPVRAGFRRLRPAGVARRALGLDADQVTIVVMGGSQGARSINEAVATLLTQYALPRSWQVLHVTGERDYAVTRVREKTLAPGNTVRTVPYLDDPADAYAAADIIVARAGASTLAELAVTATPAILIPYPHAADGHQAANAAVFAAAGAAMVIRDADLDAESLLKSLRHVLDTDELPAMREAAAGLSPADAVANIVDCVTAVVAPRVPNCAEPKLVARD